MPDIGFKLSRSLAQEIDGDYIVPSGEISDKSQINTYVQNNIPIIHDGMQLYFKDLRLGVILLITRDNSGNITSLEHVELGGGGIALVANSTEEQQLVNSLTSDDAGQLIYNQSDNSYKTWDGSNLIESSGQIITPAERNKLIPKVEFVTGSNQNKYLTDETNYLKFDWRSKGKLINNSGTIINFNSNLISRSGQPNGKIRFVLPETLLLPQGWHMFFIVTNGNRNLEYVRENINLSVNPFSKSQAVAKFMTAVYNIGSGTSNEFSVIGNVLDIT